MSSSSDSDDDVPLSQLKKSLTPGKTKKKQTPAKKKKTPAKKKKTPAKKKKTPAKKKKTPAKKKKVESSSEEESESEYEEESESEESSSDEDSSDDEISLADLKKKMKKTAAAKKKKKAAASKKRSRSKKPAKRKKKKKSNTNKAKSTSTGILGTTLISTYKDADGARQTVKLNRLTKQQIVTGVLCRWWYAFDWPTAENLEQARKEMEDTKNYREMAGMPGVFICILGEDTGKIIDKRDFKKGIVPSVSSLMKRPSGELLDLWIKALNGQIKALEESEAEDNPKLLEALNKELKNVTGANREKIENACVRQKTS